MQSKCVLTRIRAYFMIPAASVFTFEKIEESLCGSVVMPIPASPHGMFEVAGARKTSVNLGAFHLPHRGNPREGLGVRRNIQKARCGSPVYLMMER